MKTRLLITIFLLITGVALSAYLVNDIKSRHDELETIAASEDAVKQQLRMIRETFAAFHSTYNDYPESWAELEKFAATGKIYVINKKEKVFPNTPYYGVDSIAIIYDTVQVTSARDSLFPASKYPDFDPATLGTIPGKETKFSFWTGTISETWAYEIIDTLPENPDRQLGLLPELKIGSSSVPTTRGSWEK